MRRAQRQYIYQHFGNLLPEPSGDQDLHFFYRPRELLVREEYLEQVAERLGLLQMISPAQLRTIQLRAQGVVAGVRLVRLDGPGDLDTLTTLRSLLHGTPASGQDAAEQFSGLGPGAASLNHLVHITHGDVGHCPASEPEPVAPCTDRFPAPSKDQLAGAGVRVVVLDTKLDDATRDRNPWMAGVRATGNPPPGPQPPPGTDRYAGHGTFIAGVIKTIAPSAEVLVRPVFQHCGAAMEAELVEQLNRIMEEDEPDIISMSAGTYTFENNGLLGLNAFYENRLRHHKGVVLVAAAGNDTHRTPFWPAAATFAVAAGALNRQMNDRADYSNFGGWVDLYAPGTDIINVFPLGPYVYQEPPHSCTNRVETFTGLASWSGTSFATPIVAGLIATRMSHTGESGRDAAAALIETARATAYPGVGAVLLPK